MKYFEVTNITVNITTNQNQVYRVKLMCHDGNIHIHGNAGTDFLGVSYDNGNVIHFHFALDVVTEYNTIKANNRLGSRFEVPGTNDRIEVTIEKIR